MMHNESERAGVEWVYMDEDEKIHDPESIYLSVRTNAIGQDSI